ncbi:MULTISPECIES: HAD family hydrolase [Agrococcus]|uniref:Hydrolase n=1 Tax=Agrococcus baldri TaxID=153730 RepID=A0AA87US16_9MICO|nr:HAD family hydrolase [Agrococcus baldri]MCH1881786.1 Cof-type HAD-IIB family hydrolase [Agrococcus sp. ARC_14]GEK79965.1 hydrolase [Agrococcus baldri]
MKTAPDLAADVPPFDVPADLDIRLVVCDMDGTLLDADGRVPDAFWPLLTRMQAAGIAFAPASGRQLATLEHLFARAGTFSCIAENGAIATHDGEVIGTTTVDPDAVRQIVHTVRESDGELDLVASRREIASIESTDPVFVAEAQQYHVAFEVVEDLLDRTDDVLKLAVYAASGSAAAAERWLTPGPAGHRVMIGSPNWADVIHDSVDKRLGVEALQRELGVTPAQTVVFGDYLNDLGMLADADWTFAMANAHPDVLATARYRAPSNVEHGVVQVLERLLV